jgi:hypothetical protein
MESSASTNCSTFQNSLLLPKSAAHHRPWMKRPWKHRGSETTRPRVFDAFMFAGEFELLQTRLHVLSSVVDVFVIVEADVAHSGSYNRSLTFLAARERFRPYLHRIRYLGLHSRDVPHMRGCTSSPGASRGRISANAAMRCEHVMRGSLLREVIAAGAQPTDILISGDVDEIPRPEFITPFRDCELFDGTSTLSSHPAVVIFLAEMRMYNSGCYSGQSRWSYGPKVGAVFQFDLLRDEPWRGSNGMNYRRWGNSAESGPRWANAAWHLTNFMTPEALAKKLEGFFHFRDFSGADRALNRLALLMARCKSPYPDKYRRMRWQPPKLGSPAVDALAYIDSQFPALRAQPPG